MLDDLLAGAGRLSQQPLSDRPGLARQLLAEAHAAHHYMRRTGKPHVRWGNGSLMARALSDAPTSCPPLCLASLAVMVDAVVTFRRENSTRGHGLSDGCDLC